MMSNYEAVAKLVWIEPATGEKREFVLSEGATATIGRSSQNDIQIASPHVSRQHAVISYREGIFMVSDLGSSNGTYVNEEQITAPFPLFAGDVLRFYDMQVEFQSANDADARSAEQSGHFIVPGLADGQCSLTVTNGPQEGQTIALLLEEVRIGRATLNADWDILLQDQSVSRPHARLKHEDGRWYVYDLDSSNGTRINGEPLQGSEGRALTDGDTVAFGAAMLLFRVGWQSPGDQQRHTSETINES